jgi:hypothetical protein
VLPVFRSRRPRLRPRLRPRRWRRRRPARWLAGLAATVTALAVPPAAAAADPPASPASSVSSVSPASPVAPARPAVAATVAAAAAVADPSVPAVGGAPTAGRQQVGSVVHLPPVAAPVADPFRAPPHPYGTGNRGIEYDTEPGDAVAASADGQVVFAGPVAGSRHVTLLHADGVRTSYSFVADIRVTAGQRVRRGDRIAVAGDRLHFGARLGDAYFDPASLFGTTTVEVELLPLEVPPGRSVDEERAALAVLAFGRGQGVSLPGLDDAAGWALGRIELVHHYATDIEPARRNLELAWDVTRRLSSPPDCTAGPAPIRPAARRERVALLVGGLGSSSDSASVDELRTGELGYRDGAVVRFSYQGGRTPDTGAGFTGLPARTYASADTQGDLRASARRLADAVEAIVAERPDVLVDVYAHSMGGVVTRLALLELDRRGLDPARLGLVATLGAPHKGADLATAVAAANTTAMGDAAVDVVARLLDTGLDPDAPAAAQLAETSDVVAELAAHGLPDGIELVSLAASGDVVVPSPATEVDGARNVTVGLVGRHAHGDLVGSDAATDELALAVADRPPRCEADATAVAEEVLGHGISYAEDLGGAALLGVAP